jgi:hypothetical protein
MKSCTKAVDRPLYRKAIFASGNAQSKRGRLEAKRLNTAA